MALRRPRAQRSLVAATSTVPLGPDASWRTWRFTTDDWQTESWRLYDIIGELRFLANWIGDSVSQAEMFVTEVSDTGEETGPVEDERIAELASLPLGSGSERDDNLRLAGIDLAVAGECYFVAEGRPDEDTDRWFTITSSQIRRLGDKVIVNPSVMHSGGLSRDLVLENERDLLVRVWRPHPNAIDVADSPTRAAIPPLREVELLTKREFAELDSRLTGAGVWPLPEGIDFPRGDDDPPGIRGFMAYLQRAVGTSMRDQSSATAMVPTMFTVPDQFIEHIDKLKPITFWSELSGEIGAMKEAAIRRLGNAFDIPSEILTGLAAANHWTAWAISEEGIKRIKPYLSYIAAALTRSWLRPALAQMSVDRPDRFAFTFDTSPLAVRPNRQGDALDLYDRGLISAVTAIRAGAWSDDQMPDEQEQTRRIVLDAVKSQPNLLEDPGVRSLLGINIPLSISPAEDDSRVRPAAPDRQEDEDEIPDTLDDGPDEDEPLARVASLMHELDAARQDRRARQVRRDTPAGRMQDEALFAVCKMAVLRALELAGGRLTSPGDRRHRWANTPRHELHVQTGGCAQDKAEQIIEGAFGHAEGVLTEIGYDADAVKHVLSRYTTTLLTQGMAHSDDLLTAALRGVS